MSIQSIGGIACGMAIGLMMGGWLLSGLIVACLGSALIIKRVEI